MRTITIFISACMILLIASCSEDFVNLENPNLSTSSTFWKTQGDALLGTNAMYQALIYDGTYKRKYPWTMDVRADDTYNVTETGYVMAHITNYTIGGEEVNQPWECNYAGIYRANQVLDKLDGIPMDSTLRERCRGEAYFVRGLCYFNLLILYRNVVLYTHEPQSVDDFYIPQSDPADVWEVVIQDFKDAIKGCWNKNETRNGFKNDLGRATKAAAAAFLAKAYMMNQRFSEAQPVLKDIIDGVYGAYSLTTNYGDNFFEANENNEESIFEIQFDASFGSNEASWIGDPQVDWLKVDGYNKGLAPKGPGINCWGDICPSVWIFNEFQKERTIDDKKDPRMEISILYYHEDDPTYTFYGMPQDTIFSQGYASTGHESLGITDSFKLWVGKYVYAQGTKDAEWRSGINRRLVRYADVLLLYAECLNEAGQTAAAYPIIQQVRNRANLPYLATAKPGLNQDEMREQISHERALELCFETWRYVDLLRWGCFEDENKLKILLERDKEYLKYYNPDPNSDGNEADKVWLKGREYLAIPPEEIDRTNGVVHQNPGWN